VNCYADASESQPRSNTQKNGISPAKGVNKMKAEEHPRTNKSHLRTINRVDSSSLSKSKYAIDVEPIPSRLRNNREAHLDYLRHLKESVGTIHKIVEEAKVIRPLDSSIVSTCRYTKHS
nr:hypothetical protein [Tanacetum cinerariifolium]